MNSVQSLIADPFGKRTIAEKIEVKHLGRPIPNLNLKQSVSSKTRIFNRLFNPDIYNKHLWICGCDIKNALFCFPCLLFEGEELWTKTGLSDLNHLSDRVKKHCLSQRHIKNVVQLSLFGNVDIAAQMNSTYRRNIASHNKKVKHNRYVLNIIINSVRFCEALEVALRGHDESILSSNLGLINFSAELDVALKEHLEKAAVFQGTSKNIQNEILQTMISVCQERISKEIEEADYLSVIVDETTDTSNKYQMAVVFRYIVKGKPVERFWNFLALSDHKAKLSTMILAELETHIKDNDRKLIAQTYDWASIMSESCNVVQELIKKTYKYAAYVHCYSHQLDLVMLNAASTNNNVRIFFANLQGICTFFSNSSQRIAILDEIVKKRLPRSAPTRWDFNSKIVGTVFEHRKDILETMRRILDESKTESITTINQVSGYITLLTNKSFIFWLNLFYKIMPQVDILYAKFQTREIDHLIANKSVLSFVTQLIKIRNNITNTQDSGPSTTKRLKIAGDEYTREAKEVCDIIICQAKDRFSFTGHLAAASLFYAEKFNQYSLDFPENMFQETIKSYPYFDERKLRSEVSVIYETEDFKSISGFLPLYDIISQNNELTVTFSETLKLLKILITTPMTPAEEELCFSTLTRIKAFLRNSMAHERLSALVMLSQEKDFIQSIPDFNQRVIDKFANTEHRRMDFLFQ